MTRVTIQDYSMERVLNLLYSDKLRLEALEHVYQLGLSDAYLAAGFVRNMIWDSLHGYQNPTPLNDLDVIYFDPDECEPNKYQEYEAQLRAAMPRLNWQVRNQAKMHTRNGDREYLSSLDAMGFWPEKETAVGIRQIGTNQYLCHSAFEIESLFQGCITHNPKRDRAIFDSRITAKAWLTHWPKLRVVR